MSFASGPIRCTSRPRIIGVMPDESTIYTELKISLSARVESSQQRAMALWISLQQVLWLSSTIDKSHWSKDRALCCRIESGCIPERASSRYPSYRGRSLCKSRSEHGDWQLPLALTETSSYLPRHLDYPSSSKVLQTLYYLSGGRVSTRAKE